MYNEPYETKPCSNCEYREYDSFHDELYCTHKPLPEGLLNNRGIIDRWGTCEYWKELNWNNDKQEESFLEKTCITCDYENSDSTKCSMCSIRNDTNTGYSLLWEPKMREMTYEECLQDSIRRNKSKQEIPDDIEKFIYNTLNYLNVTYKDDSAIKKYLKESGKDIIKKYNLLDKK